MNFKKNRAGSSVDIADNLYTNSDTIALAASQGMALRQLLDDILGIGRYLAIWDCTTGQPTSLPHATPYTYLSGDYFRVGAVGSTNYMPDGSSYTGAASTTVCTDTLAVGDLFCFDGSVWKPMLLNGSGVVVRSVLDTPMVANTIYTLGSVSTLSMTLPSTGSAGDEISVEFTASAAFTPSVSGTYYGEVPFAATSAKKYVYTFAWVCGVWALGIFEM